MGHAPNLIRHAPNLRGIFSKWRASFSKIADFRRFSARAASGRQDFAGWRQLLAARPPVFARNARRFAAGTALADNIIA
jgi:hypothetical protein